jgi:hypothetical protein
VEQAVFYVCTYLFLFSHFWLATPQEVLQADWQEVWHSPQPPFFTLLTRLRVARVRILFIVLSPLGNDNLTGLLYRDLRLLSMGLGDFIFSGFQGQQKEHPTSHPAEDAPFVFFNINYFTSSSREVDALTVMVLS